MVSILKKHLFVVIIKPDAFKRNLHHAIAEAISINSKKNNTNIHVVKTAIKQPSLELAQEHYFEHVGKPHFDRITNGLSGGKQVCVILYTCDTSSCLFNTRKFCTSDIRNMFTVPGSEKHENVIHCSDSPHSGEREASLWFKDSDYL